MASSKPRLMHQESPDLGPFVVSDEPAMIMEFSPLSYQQAKGGRKRKINKHRSLGTLGVVAIVYFYGSGGPVGNEPLVSAGGPLVGMIASVVYPLVMTLPYAWVVAELCSAFPEDGGFAIWILHAFGPFWACQVGYWTWLSCIIFGAMVPTLFVDVFGPYMHLTITSYWGRYVARVIFATVFSIPSIFGTKCVSRISIALFIVVLVPYVVFTIWAYSECHAFDVLLDVRHVNSTLTGVGQENDTSGPVFIDWKTLLNTLFWNFSGINIASVFAGEVKNPSRVFSRAIFIAVVLSIVTVVFPIPAAVVGGDMVWWKFDQGSYVQIAQQVGGEFLKVLVLISATATAIGLYVSGSYCQAFELSGMADNELVPQVLGIRNKRFRTPHVAILTSWICILLLSTLEFHQLLPVTNILACAVELLIVLAAIRLRRTLPFIPRPTKMPGGVPVLVFVAICASMVLSGLAYTSLNDLVEVAMLVGGLIPGLLYGWYDKFLRLQLEVRC